ncbi:MAG TPA: WD40 repeat domain-containing protein, partial [Gemmataceae bacterium]|nr:WD40 repeat domain-containing protein [Gemmataceae bacterium]
RAACSGTDRMIHLIDPVAGKVLRPLPLETSILALAFTPGGKLLVLGGGFLRLWQIGPDAAGDEEVWKLRIPTRPGQRGTVGVSPDGKSVAASASLVLIVADAQTGMEQFRIDRSHIEDTGFQVAAFSPDSRRLITGSGGTAGAVQVWDMTTRALVRRYSTGLGGVTRLTVFPDGSRVASAGADEAITIWDLSK